MALSKLFDEILVENIINELFDFDKIVPYNFSKVGNDLYKFDINPNVTCNVRLEDVTIHKQNVKFSPILQNVQQIINASFDLNGVDTQYSKENLSELLKILLTVKTCIGDYIDRTKPECVVIVPMSKLGQAKSDRQKDMIYRSIWKKYPVSGYGISDVKVNSYDAFCLYNIDKIKRK